MTDKISDTWSTPLELFNTLNEEFGFHTDLCASKSNAKCSNYFDDYLHHTPTQGATHWCNPPYSNPKPFIEKAWEDSKHCKIVLLVKCDPSTRWWATFWEYEGTCTGCMGQVPEHDCMEYDVYIGPKPGCDYKFFPRRIKFDPPQQLIESGEVWKVKTKWVQKCSKCKFESLDNKKECAWCKGRGYTELSGPTFPCALLIFDRRGL